MCAHYLPLEREITEVSGQTIENRRLRHDSEEKYLRWFELAKDAPDTGGDKCLNPGDVGITRKYLFILQPPRHQLFHSTIRTFTRRDL